MNTVDVFFKQQFGKLTWKSYDSCLSRLRCVGNDEFKQIVPSNGDQFEPLDTPIFACKFAQKEGFQHILALANEDGMLAIHDTKYDKPRIGKKIHYNAIFDLAWLCDQMKLVTVSGDHTARLVDVNRDDLVVSELFTGHTRSVKTVASQQTDYSIFATGSRDGCVFVWDIRIARKKQLVCAPDVSIISSHQIRSHVLTPQKKRFLSSHLPLSGANSVTGLVFQDQHTLISCGAGDGSIKFWDLRKTYRTYKREPTPKYVIPYAGSTTRNGFSNLILDNAGFKLYASCLDNTIYSYNINRVNPEPIMQYVGHQNSTFYVKTSLSNDGRYLLSGSSDQNAYIWNTNNINPIVKLRGHNAEVTCVAWRPTFETALVTCSDDMRHKIWRIGTEMLPEDWDVNGCGEAEALDVVTQNKKKSAEDNLPTQVKKLRRCVYCSHHFDKTCENCDYNVNKGKRILMYDDEDGPRKKFSPRCLFIPTNSQQSSGPSGQKRKCESETCFTLKFPRTVDGGADVSTVRTGTSRSFLPIQNESPFVTVNHQKDVFLKESPIKMEPQQNFLTFSPTSNLPNFAVDGSAPHLHYSPKKRQDRDWLTKIRIEKSLISRFDNLVSNEEQNLNKTENSSPKGRKVQKKHQSNSLLNFFKMTNNSSMKDEQCSSKYSFNSVLSCNNPNV